MKLIDADQIEWYKDYNEKGEFLGFIAHKEEVDKMPEYQTEMKDMAYTALTITAFIAFMVFLIKFVGA